MFVAGYALNLLVGLVSLHQGPDGWERWVSAQSSPLALALAACTLALVLIHAVTWFQAAPKIIRVRVGRRYLSRWWVVLAHYLILGAVTVFILFFMGVV